MKVANENYKNGDNTGANLINELRKIPTLTHQQDEYLDKILNIIKSDIDFLNEDLIKLIRENMYFVKGLVLIALKDYDKALEIFEERNFDGELRKKAIYYRGICLLGMGNSEAGIYYLETFGKENVNEIEKQKVNYNLGIHYYEKKDTSKAITHLKEGVNGSDEKLKQKSYLGLGLCHYRKKSFRIAKKMFENALNGPDKGTSDISYTFIKECEEKLSRKNT